MKISEIGNDLVRVAATWKGETCIVSYRPSRYTPQFIKDHAGVPLVDEIPDLIESWDVVDEHDAVLPITPDVLKPLPFGFLNAVYAAVIADVRLGSLGEVPAP